MAAVDSLEAALHICVAEIESDIANRDFEFGRLSLRQALDDLDAALRTGTGTGVKNAAEEVGWRCAGCSGCAAVR